MPEVRQILYRPRGMTHPAARDPRPHRPLRRFPGAVRHRHDARAGRNHRHHRRQWRRQIVLSQGHCRTGPRRRPAASCSRAGRSARLAAADISSSASRLVPEGRRLFPVADRRGKSADRKLRSTSRRAHGRSTASMRCFRRSRPGALAPSQTLSGGEQQMAAIGRALMSNPRVLLCGRNQPGARADRDPQTSTRRCRASRQNGTSIVLVEQDIAQAMKVADRVYCFQEGRVSLAGPPGRPDPRAGSSAPISDVEMLDLDVGLARSFKAFCSAASMRCSPPACR